LKRNSKIIRGKEEVSIDSGAIMGPELLDHDEHYDAELTYTLKLAKPSDPQTRIALHNYIDFLLDANMTECNATVTVTNGRLRESAAGFGKAHK
jgi:hypothetical protein